MKGTTRSVFEVIIFSILTCGIYHLYWIYATTNELNDYLRDDDTSGGLVILYSILTCGIYGIYWYYKMGKKILDAQRLALGYGNDDSVLYLILCILGLSLVSSAIMQSNLNKVWQGQ